MIQLERPRFIDHTKKIFKICYMEPFSYARQVSEGGDKLVGFRKFHLLGARAGIFTPFLLTSMGILTGNNDFLMGAAYAVAAQTSAVLTTSVHLYRYDS